MPEFRDLFDTSLRCVTPPTDEPLELDRAKSHCNVPLDLAEFDLDFIDWISAAREQVETDSERSLMPQTWELTLDRFPQARSVYAGVVITFQTGYANAAAVPRTALQAMRMLVAHWFRTREAAGERPTKDHDRAYAALISSLKWRP